MPRENRRQTTESVGDPYLEITIDVYRELVRQTRQTFNIHLFSTAASIMIILIGCALPFVGHPIAGVLLAVAGGGTTSFCSQLAKQSQHRLENLLREVKQLHYYS
ncbi:MAG: hypothetical protein AAF703_15350 [Cyanobacteria bacterium P01_D01_bin.105]